MVIEEKSVKSLEEVCSEIEGTACYIDPQESDPYASSAESFIIYDADGDVLYRWLKDQKCFFKNSPAFKDKREKRNISELSIFTSEEQFQWSTVWNSPNAGL